MSAEIHLLDDVALLEDLPDRGLRRGQVGAIAEVLGPSEFEVEFADSDGRTYASAALRKEQLLLLLYDPA